MSFIKDGKSKIIMQVNMDFLTKIFESVSVIIIMIYKIRLRANYFDIILGFTQTLLINNIFIFHYICNIIILSLIYILNLTRHSIYYFLHLLLFETLFLNSSYIYFEPYSTLDLLFFYIYFYFKHYF